MVVKINGEPQKSFEQFQATFRRAFGDVTPDIRTWLLFANFSNDSVQQRDANEEA